MALVDIAKGLLPFKPPHYSGDDEATRLWSEQMEAYMGERFAQYDLLLRGGLRWENLRAKLILGEAVTSGGTQNVHTAVVHDLGKIPELMFFLARLTGQRFFVSAADKTAWTTGTCQFTEETGAGGTVDIFVM